MRALIRKEWRENRWLIYGFLVVVPLLSIGLKWGIVGWKDTEPVHSIKIVLPILTLLYVLAIAADIVAADASSGRMGFLFALPVRPRKVWAAKAVFLFGGALLFMVYVLLVEVAILSLAGKWVVLMFSPDALRQLYLMLPVLVVGCATMAFSSLVDRGLAAAILALLFVAGIAWAASALRSFGVEIEPDEPVFYSLSALVAAAFLFASFAAVTIGRIHLGARLRRVALAAAAFLVVLVPPTAWAGARIHRWRHIQPSHEDVRLDILDVDPDGKWALVMATREGDGPANAQPAPHALWAVSLDTPTVRTLTGHGWSYGGADTWVEGHDRVVLYRWVVAVEGSTSTLLRVVYDLEKAEVVTARPVLPGTPNPVRTERRGPLLIERTWNTDRNGLSYQVHREGRKPIEVPQGWMPAMPARSWALGVFRHGPGAGWKYALWEMESGTLTPIDVMPGLLPSAPAEHGWTVRTQGNAGDLDCRIDRVPLDNSAVETVIGGKGRGLSERSGHFAFAYIDGEAFWVDADAAGPVRLPGIRFESPEPCILWSTNGRVCLVTDHRTAYRITATANGPRVRRISTPRIEHEQERSMLWFDGERWLRMSPDRSALYVHDMDGTTRRLLPTRE